MTKFQSIRALWVASVAVSVASASLIGEAAAGCRAGAPPRIVHRAYTYRDIVEPGLYPVTREPSRYGWVSKPVKVPGPVIWHDEPPVYRTVHVKVRKPGCWAVEKRVIDGRPAVCPVYVPSTYTTVERQVLVRPPAAGRNQPHR